MIVRWNYGNQLENAICAGMWEIFPKIVLKILLIENISSPSDWSKVQKRRLHPGALFHADGDRRAR